MSVFQATDFNHHEQVVFVNDKHAGLKAIIAIHNTAFGPALGGCRMWDYPSEEEGLRDVLRLSRGMTYKAALANVAVGGGKTVILGKESAPKSAELMHAMGRAIEKLKGRYVTGPDIGTGVEDMTNIRETTAHVIGVDASKGGYGDPSPSTARGVFMGIRAGLQHKHGSADLKDVKVMVQGLGHVGYNLCRFLHEEGAQLFVADVNAEAVERAESELGAIAVAVDDVYSADVDVYAPCAFGAVINDNTLDRFKAGIISGGANNQLDQDRHGEALKELGIIYLPDYVANGGGLVQVAAEWYKEPEEIYRPKVDAIYETCLSILKKANEDDISTSLAADRIGEERVLSAENQVTTAS